MPSDWKAFKRDWKKGKYLECTPLLERPKNTSRKIPIKFLDRLVEFSNLLDKHNATAFLMGGTLLGNNLFLKYLKASSVNMHYNYHTYFFNPQH